MKTAKAQQHPLRLADAGKREVRTQFGALCWRKHRDGVEVILITSRRSKRWILPKGWPVDGATPSEAAAAEAWEEAGVVGKVQPTVTGMFSYAKVLDDSTRLPCLVAVFPLKVRSVSDNWPERQERRRKWFSLKKAASLVDNPELAVLLKNFDPTRL